MAINQAMEDFTKYVKEHLRQFMTLSRSGVYGVGFFCDGFTGDALLVANSQDYHAASFRQFQGSCMEDRFRWEIGNWEYPAGLFPSASLEQGVYQEEWSKIKTYIGDSSQATLEQLCKTLLLEIHDCENSPLADVEGIVVAGPDDSAELILTKRILFEPEKRTASAPGKLGRGG